MTKQYIIRHKETHEQFSTSRGKKSVWKTPGHAKAAYTNKYAYRSGVRFDDQDVYEIVEVVSVQTEQLQRAEMLLARAYSCLGNADYDLNLSKDIHDYFGEKSHE